MEELKLTKKERQRYMRAIGSIGGRNWWKRQSPEAKAARIEQMRIARKEKQCAA